MLAKELSWPDFRLCDPRRFYDLQCQRVCRRAERKSVPQHGRGDIFRLRKPLLEIYGHGPTVAGLSGNGTVENTETETGVVNGGSLSTTLRTTLSAAMCQQTQGQRSALPDEERRRRLDACRANTGSYTGGLTVNAGTLDCSGGEVPTCNYMISGGTLNIGAIPRRSAVSKSPAEAFWAAAR